jgi:S1-C subfamily serine protease
VPTQGSRRTAQTWTPAGLPAVALALFAAACASTPVIEGPAPALLPPPPPASAVVSTEAPPGKLYRDDVVRFVDAGFPQFLQRIEVSADVRDGKFAGWVVRALHPRDFWQNVDLQPGDVVTQVNGSPVERETQAYDTFVALKTAPRLNVSYVRAGQPRTLGYDIIERPQTAPVASAR